MTISVSIGRLLTVFTVPSLYVTFIVSAVVPSSTLIAPMLTSMESSDGTASAVAGHAGINENIIQKQSTNAKILFFMFISSSFFCNI